MQQKRSSTLPCICSKSRQLLFSVILESSSLIIMRTQLNSGSALAKVIGSSTRMLTSKQSYLILFLFSQTKTLVILARNLNMMTLLANEKWCFKHQIWKEEISWILSIVTTIFLNPLIAKAVHDFNTLAIWICYVQKPQKQYPITLLSENINYGSSLKKNSVIYMAYIPLNRDNISCMSAKGSMSTKIQKEIQLLTSSCFWY